MIYIVGARIPSKRILLVIIVLLAPYAIIVFVSWQEQALGV